MLRGIHCELRLRGSSLEIFGECWVTSVLMPETQHFGDLIFSGARFFTTINMDLGEHGV